MRKTDAATITEMRAFALAHPDQNYRQLAISFSVSEVTVKRHCADLGRGKDWRKDRKQVEDTGALRFWSAVEKLGPDDCWEWQGCINDSGYGVIHFRGKSQGAHRVAYLLTHGEIPADTELDHLCRNRPCCNPRHLEPIHHEENMRRVREARTKNIVGLQPLSYPVFDTVQVIDTGRDTQPQSDNDRTRTISNLYSINPNTEVPEPPAVSMRVLAEGPGGLLKVELHGSKPEDPVHHEDRTQPEKERPTTSPASTSPAGDRTGNNIQPARRSGEIISVFQPRGKSLRAGGFDLRIVAKDIFEAKRMFVFTWGDDFEATFEQVGVTDDLEEISIWEVEWKEKLGQLLKEWKSGTGKRVFAAIEAERRERFFSDENFRWLPPYSVFVASQCGLPPPVLTGTARFFYEATIGQR